MGGQKTLNDARYFVHRRSIGWLPLGAKQSKLKRLLYSSKAVEICARAKIIRDRTFKIIEQIGEFPELGWNIPSKTIIIQFPAKEQGLQHNGALS
ncbi:hypothetical protein SDJN02_13190, partial [Cucurbita argyrosperma subsp. argyrosperma]